MFHKIDFNKWPRGPVFYYFSKMAPTAYSITIELEVTELLKKLKETGTKFFPTYLWLVTKNLNKQIEFKCAFKDGEIGYYDELTPLYATWHDDDKTFSLMWTEYNEDFGKFYRNYMENQRLYGGNHGILAQSETPPPDNAYTISEVPWVSFKHFAVHNLDNKEYFFPSVEAGKIENRDGRCYLPLSLTCHHATTDGYHISEFIKGLQEDMNNFIVSSQLI